MKNPEQKVFYENATKKILERIKTLKLAKEKQDKAIKLVQLFREAFTKEEVKKATFLGPDNNKFWDLGYDSGGFCRVSSITFAIAMGDFQDWQLMAINEDQWPGKMSHHWLKHVPTNTVFDITYDQFAIDGLQVPYDLGQKAAYGLSLQDETHKFAKSVGLDIIQLLKGPKAK